MEVPELPYTVQQIADLRAAWTRNTARIGLNAASFLDMIVSLPLVIFWQNAGTMLVGMALYRSGFVRM